MTEGVPSGQILSERVDDDVHKPADGSPDREFALKAASAGRMMVALGRKAQEQGLDAEVKRYARRMVEDHRGAMDEMRRAARGKKIPLSTTMTGAHQGGSQQAVEAPECGV